jgi:DNA-binding response OmpR family regulator
VELAAEDGQGVPAERLLADLHEALHLVAAVEKAALGIVSVLVLDDDERLGELTARGLRRAGYDATSESRFRAPRDGEVVVLDLGLVASLALAERDVLRSAQPIVVTGATDPASRRLAEELDAFAYLVKPAEPEELAACVQRRVERFPT